MGSTNVYKTKNEGAALMVTNGCSQEVASEGMAPADPVAALADTHQQVSAQYAMLTAK